MLFLPCGVREALNSRFLCQVVCYFGVLRVNLNSMKVNINFLMVFMLLNIVKIAGFVMKSPSRFKLSFFS